MKNYVKEGRMLTAPAPAGGAVSGNGYLIGSLFGVCAVSADAGVDTEFCLDSVFELDKTTAQAWAVGDKIFWDNSTKKCTTVSSGNTLVGTAVEVAALADITGIVRLDGHATPSLEAAASLTMAAAAGAANVTEVTITVKDGSGNTIPAVHHLDVYLSDDADGEGLTAATATGTVQAKAASGTVLNAMVAKKALRVQTLKTGVFVLEITDTAKTAFNVVGVINGKAIVGETLAAADYGA